jgi:hypothetical protein
MSFTYVNLEEILRLHFQVIEDLVAHMAFETKTG